MTTSRRTLGDQGEGHARRYLEARGLTFLAANWRCRHGELDLVMHDGEVLVFVEAKIRRGEAMGRAEEAITPAQASRLLRAANGFIAEHPAWEDAIWRIDVIAITLGQGGTVERVTHIENAVGEW